MQGSTCPTGSALWLVPSEESRAASTRPACPGPHWLVVVGGQAVPCLFYPCWPLSHCEHFCTCFAAKCQPNSPGMVSFQVCRL